MPETQTSATTTVARNSFWYGLDILVENLAALCTTVLIPRALGPVNLGRFAYVAWMVTAVRTVGYLGIPEAARKYMAECLARKDFGYARAVFTTTGWWVSGVALFSTTTGLFVAIYSADPPYRWMAVLLVASLLPAMLTAIPTQGNVAAENFRANFWGPLTGNILYVGITVLTLIRGWSVAGLAAALLAKRTAEALVRGIPAIRWIRRFPEETLPSPLRSKLIRFAAQSLLIALVATVVWDRIEILFLKHLSADIRQVAFYSMSFGIVQFLQEIPTIFAGAAGATLLAQYGRDPSRLPAMVSAAARYLGLVGLPVFFGMASVSSPLVRVLYGERYLEAIPVLALCAILVVPRIFLMPVWNFLQATEQQGVLIRAMCWAAAVDVGLAVLLIPQWGALGAVVANGVAQCWVVVRVWQYVSKHSGAQPPWRVLVRVVISSGVMAVTVFQLVRLLPPAWALGVGVPAGAVIYLVMLRATRCLEASDRKRLLQFRPRSAGGLRTCFDAALVLLFPVTDSRESA